MKIDLKIVENYIKIQQKEIKSAKIDQKIEKKCWKFDKNRAKNGKLLLKTNKNYVKNCQRKKT